MSTPPNQPYLLASTVNQQELDRLVNELNNTRDKLRKAAQYQNTVSPLIRAIHTYLYCDLESQESLAAHREMHGAYRNVLQYLTLNVLSE